MFPEYNPKRIFDDIETGVKLFGTDNQFTKIPLCLGGYALRRTSDGSFWGTDDGHAYVIFTKEEYAKKLKVNLAFSYPDEVWDILYVGGVWINKDPHDETVVL